jgi:hypothetical protein
MTTLRARWEKQDYTGVTAEVPLGHISHPKIFQNQPILAFLSFQDSVRRFGRSTPRLQERCIGTNLQHFCSLIYGRSSGKEQFFGLKPVENLTDHSNEAMLPPY